MNPIVAPSAESMREARMQIERDMGRRYENELKQAPFIRRLVIALKIQTQVAIAFIKWTVPRELRLLTRLR